MSDAKVDIQGNITITRERLFNLLDAERELEALRAGGVEDWDWYSASIDDHYVDLTNEDLDKETAKP